MARTAREPEDWVGRRAAGEPGGAGPEPCRAGCAGVWAATGGVAPIPRMAAACIKRLAKGVGAAGLSSGSGLPSGILGRAGAGA